MSEQVFVAREQELEQLHKLLERTAAGQGQAVFITGEAGSGKTVLITEFVNRVCTMKYPDLVAAFGDCDAQFGVRDPYRPFIEIMEQLTGNVEDQFQQPAQNRDRLRALLSVSGEVLGELGPDLIDIFVPGAGLLTRAGAYVAERAGWMEKLGKNGRPTNGNGIEQKELLEQYCHVILSISTQQPLILVLDDLQWVDVASATLLKHLLQEMVDSRLLLIGAYRPAEVDPDGNHPLRSILSDLPPQTALTFLAMPNDTDAVRSRHFVSAYLDAQYNPNHFEAELVETIFDRTQGHPLFVIELLRDLEARGLVVHEQGVWKQTQTIHRQDLPERVGKVIAQRLAYLDERLQDILAVGAVEGEEFTAQVIAAVEGIDERHLVKLLSRTLARQQALIQEWKIVNVNGRPLLIYRFLQNMVQEYLYENLSELERCMLHGAVARELEVLYRGHEEEAAPALARHYCAAREYETAIRYLLLAGERAMRKHANTEALGYYNQARDVSLNIPDPPRDLTLRLLKNRGFALRMLGRLDDALHDFKHGLVIARELEDRREEGLLLQRMSNIHVSQKDLDHALKHAWQAAEIAAEIHDEELRADALSDIAFAYMNRSMLDEAIAVLKEAVPCYHNVKNEAQAIRAESMKGRIHTLRGEAAEALEAFQAAIDLLRKAPEQRELPFNLRLYGLTALHYQNDYQTALQTLHESMDLYEAMEDYPGLAWTLVVLAETEIALGEIPAAKEHSQAALDLARETQDPEITYKAHTLLGRIAQIQGDGSQALAHFEAALPVARSVESAFSAIAPAYLASALAEQNAHDRAKRCLAEAMEAIEAGQAPWTTIEVLRCGVEVWRLIGDHDRALALADRLEAQAETLGTREYIAWAHRLRGQVLKDLGDPTYVDEFQKSTAIARRLGNRILAEIP